MKLYRFVFLFVMGCIACLALQPTQAQDDFAASLAEVAMYDEDAAYLDEMMAFYFGEAFGSWFGEEEDSIQVTAAASSVSNVRAVSNSPIFVNVTWTGSHYKHKVFANDVLKFDGLTVPGGTTRSHQLVLSPGTTYRIKVVGYDRNGVETGTMTSTPVTTLSNVPTGVMAGSAGVGKAYVSWNYLDNLQSLSFLQQWCYMDYILYWRR